ncbi:MAG: hypothetical protein Kow0092_06440 [Deferrisomatales bacterium]
MKGFGVWIAVLGIALAACSGPEPASVAKETGGLSGLAEEIFVPRCARPGCHGGSSPAAGMNLGQGHTYDSLVGARASRRPDRLRVDPGNPEGSYLLERLQPGGDTPVMPLGGPRLGPEELDRIRAWIEAGAKP